MPTFMERERFISAEVRDDGTCYKVAKEVVKVNDDGTEEVLNEKHVYRTIYPDSDLDEHPPEAARVAAAVFTREHIACYADQLDKDAMAKVYETSNKLADAKAKSAEADKLLADANAKLASAKVEAARITAEADALVAEANAALTEATAIAASTPKAVAGGNK